MLEAKWRLNMVTPLIQPKTKAKAGDEAMVRLEKAAFAKDEMAFLAARQAIDWSERPAEDFVRAIDLALLAGAFLAARNLSAEGANRFPDHTRLKNMAYILAPPVVRSVPGDGNPTWKANRAWLKTHWNEYKGQWVALHNGQLLAVGPSPAELEQQLGDLRNRDILITSIW
jgi:hypothetical protein